MAEQTLDYAPPEGECLDLVVGTTAIGDYLGISRARVLRLTETGVLPVFRLGTNFAARKSALREAIRRLEPNPPAEGSHMTAITTIPPLPAGRYGMILADPPWLWAARSAKNHTR